MESVRALKKTTFSGRRFTRKQLAEVQETVNTLPGLSRTELARTICEHLDWTTPNGKLKLRQCLGMLESLEAQGIVRLPAKVHQRKPKHGATQFMEPEAAVEGSLDALGPVTLQLATTAEDRALWRSYVQSHHYLGHKRPMGAHLAYFIVSEKRQQKLGCLLFSATATWAESPRDEWIGWDKQHREKCLQLVLVQNRFLIFPWVNVPNLASKVLALCAKQVGDDWVRSYGYRPVLLETYVDTTRFSGGCYRAANWHYLGETQGRGHDPEHKHDKSRKAIFAYPLQADWRKRLTEADQARTRKKRYRNDVRVSRARTVDEGFVALWEKMVNLLHELADEYDAKWRKRNRVLNSLMLMLLVFRLVLSRGSQSYGTTIDELWDSCDRLGIPLPQKTSVAPSSFCEARKKLDESIFKCANQRILEAYAPEAERHTWRGHRLFAVDGSKLNLPRHLTRYGYKTPSETAHYPQGLLSCLYELNSQLPFDFSLTAHTDERACAKEHLAAVRRDDVVVYDRGYFSYAMLYHHLETGIHAVFRLQESSYSVIRKFFAAPLREQIVDIVPSERTKSEIRKQHPELPIVPLRMRLVKYEIKGKVYCLGTTLLAADLYPSAELKEIYHARWGVEELYKTSKRVINVEDFHAKSERGVKQELYAHFVLLTMSRLFANQADIDLNGGSALSVLEPGDATLAENSSRQMQTNFKNCLHVFTRGIEGLLLVADRLAAATKRAYRFIIGRYQTRRPGRAYPRKSMRPDPRWQPKKSKAKTNTEISSPATAGATSA